MTRFSRCTWPIVLSLAVAPSAAFAESAVCYPLQRGDTASRLAKRITGDASNKYQPWFDIVDLSARSVPKSQYNRVRSGWRACVVEQRVQDRPPEAADAVTDLAPTQIGPAASSPSTTALRTASTTGLVTASTIALRTPNVFRQSFIALPPIADVDATYVWLGAALVVPALGFLILGGFVRRRNGARVFMTQFAYLFVREFERPLLQNAAEPAIRAQLRVSPYRARLEICLAPGKGRRYPNLSDHRKNAEYDVDRVMAALADESFARGRLRMRDGWVVVPFRFNARVKQRGVRCISSL